MKNTNTPDTVKSLASIIESINGDINNGELTEIIEVTYAYKDFGEYSWNTTLFSEFGECNVENYVSGENLLDVQNKVDNKLNLKISQIDGYIEELKEYENNEQGYDASESSNSSDHIRHGLLCDSLVVTRNSLEMALIGLPFEIEKAGGESGITSGGEVEERVSKLEELETENFGGNIRDNPIELIACYENIRGIFEGKKEVFSDGELQQYKVYLKEIEDILPSEYRYIDTSEKKKEDYFSPEMQKILDKKVNREEYSQDFLTILNDFLDLDFSVQVEKDRGSIYDGEGYIAIPGVDGYEQLTVKRILQLIVHELESHSTNFRTTEILGSFRGAGSVIKEEALAMMSEKLLIGGKLEEVGITVGFPKVLMGELLDSTALENFLSLHTKLKKDPATPHKRMLRLKRNYPLGYKGGQHKDTSYSRGVMELKEFLLNNGDIKDYFVGKVGTKDLSKMKRIIELEGKQEDVHNPLMIGELLLYYLYPSKERKEKGDFLSYIKEKYPFIDFKEDELKFLELSQKKKVVDILWHLRDKGSERSINTPEKLGINDEKLSFSDK